MTYTLSEINPPDCINRSIYGNIFSDEKASIVVSKINRLEFYNVNSPGGEPSLNLEESLSIDDAVVAIVKFRTSQLRTDWLMVLTESNALFWLGFNTLKEEFVRLDGGNVNSNGQQPLQDAEPILLANLADEASYFIMHCFQGLVLLVLIDKDANIQSLLNGTKLGKRQARMELFLNIETMSIGNIVVQQMVILQNTEKSQDTLAVLYRDFNYNYSLRYYRISPSEGRLLLLTQFEEFDEPPTCIISPKTGGLLVLTPIHIFYFPNPGVNLHLANESDDMSLSRNGNQIFLTKKLTATSPTEIISTSFKNYTIIDDTRIMLISNTGETYILYLNSELIRKNSISFNSLYLIQLGKTTVPSDVHHIDGNLFFASSKLSQSILFQIFPKKPYVNICQFMRSSPPILNIDTKLTGKMLSLLTCCGGYDSGEFKKIVNDVYYLSLLKQFCTELETTLLSLLEDGSGFFHIETKDMNGNINGEYKIRRNGSTINFESLAMTYVDPERLIAHRKVNNQNILITDKICSIDKSIVCRAKIYHAKILEKGGFVYVMEDNEIVLHNGTNIVQKFHSKWRNRQISTLDFLKISDKKYLILLAFLDGCYELHLVNEDSPSHEILVQNSIFDSQAAVVSCGIAHDKQTSLEFIWLLFLCTNGYIVQVCVDFKNMNNALNSVFMHLSDLPFTFIKNTYNEIFLFNKSQLLALILDTTTCFYKFVTVSEDLKSINDALFINENEVLISSGINNLTLYALHKGLAPFSRDKVIYSNLLNTKSLHIPNTNYSIIVCFENKLNPTNDEYQKYSYLKLVDDTLMKIIDIFEFPNGKFWDLIDLCIIPNGIDPLIPQNSFVVISNSSTKNEMLLLFHIKKNKINKLPLVDILGLSDVTDVTVQTIKVFSENELKFLICGNLTFVVQLFYDTDSSHFVWRLCPGSIVQLPIFTIDAIVKNKCVVLGDIMKGLYRADLESENFQVSLSKISTPLEPYFLTSIDVLANDSVENKLEVIFGDSLGNISCIKVDHSGNEQEQTLAFNLGDQINVIKAIDTRISDNDFTSRFDEFNSKLKLSNTVAIIGTVNGGIYSLNRINDGHKENIQKILNKCQLELVSHLRTLSYSGKTTNSIKYNTWLSRKDWKTLHRDGTGSFMRKEHFGIHDLTLVKKWLAHDFHTRHGQSRSNSDNLPETWNGLKECNKYKGVLQRLVYEGELI